MQYNGQSEVGEIKSLLLKHPGHAFIKQSHVDDQWKHLNYTARPAFDRAVAEFESFVDLLQQQVTDIHYLPSHPDTGLDSVYVHDPVIITRQGAILCNMGKQARRSEPAAIADFLKTLDIPILGAISGEGRVEGGDVVWLDERTLAVGHGYRTNAEGISQLRRLTESLVDTFLEVPLPHWTGPGDCLHLMSMISPVDHGVAAVYSRLLPVPFRQWLLGRDIALVEVPDEEYESMACNILAVAPGRCIMLAGNPIARGRLEERGIEVMEFVGNDICHKGAGGPTCLTRPLLRRT